MDFFDALNDDHKAMIARQSVFFVATAAADGRINLSPKGYDCFRVLGRKRVAWFDMAGSGNETHAHLVAAQTDRGRITVMMTNFEQPALILRIYGRARPVLPQDAEWEELSAQFELLRGTRQIFDMTVDSVQTSCGWGVPLMTVTKERETLAKYHAQADETKWMDKVGGRTRSIDGLPTRPTARFIDGR